MQRGWVRSPLEQPRPEPEGFGAAADVPALPEEGGGGSGGSGARVGTSRVGPELQPDGKGKEKPVMRMPLSLHVGSLATCL